MKKKAFIPVILTAALFTASVVSPFTCFAQEEEETEETTADINGGAEDSTANVETEAAPQATLKDLPSAGSYSLVQSVFSWGSSYDKIIVESEDTDPENYTVSVVRFDVNGEELGEGDRTILGAYASDAEGNEAEDGKYVTLEMEVGAALPLAQPYYTNPDSFYGQLKSWAECRYTVGNASTDTVWNQLSTIFHPDEEGFIGGIFEGSEFELPYAYYEPEGEGSYPLMLWLHGAGSGGTDIGFVTGGMLVTNFITDEVQNIFGGAHILLPQCPTWWLDDGGETNYTTDGSSIYTASLMELLEDYCDNHPTVDRKRIYVGGCSNGGYMTLRLALDYPEYFAAAYPVCEAYQDSWLSDEDIKTLIGTPMWFVHCSADPVVDINATASPTYERMKEAGAEDLHFTVYDEIVDPDYGNTYVGHFAWVYSLKNLCRTDYDGSPVTVDGKEVSLYEWCAAHSR